MPESKVRKSAADKKKTQRHEEEVEHRSEKKVVTPGSRRWVPPTFITVGLLGVAWLVVWYISTATGLNIPFMDRMGNWNIVIGMGLMAASFGIATLWK